MLLQLVLLIGFFQEQVRLWQFGFQELLLQVSVLEDLFQVLENIHGSLGEGFSDQTDGDAVAGSSPPPAGRTVKWVPSASPPKRRSPDTAWCCGCCAPRFGPGCRWAFPGNAWWSPSSSGRLLGTSAGSPPSKKRKRILNRLFPWFSF